jgi:selenocysteine lyase/cysteine desulfurase
VNSDEALHELEDSIEAALETYSNVHRGSGQNSLISTELFERSRQIVLEFLNLKSSQYEVIFCTPFRAAQLERLLKPSSFVSISSQELDLPFGVVAVAVKKHAFPRGVPFQTGGGTVKIVSPDHVLWANSPDKFEAGTPAIINVIAFAKALQIVQQSSPQIFSSVNRTKLFSKELFSTPEFDKLSGELLLQKLKSSLLGKSLLVPTETGPRPYANLDNGASTPTFAPVWETARRSIALSSESYPEIIQYCRKSCLDFLGSPESEYELIFTSNTTEAINIAAMNLSNSPKDEFEPVIVNSILEHNSNELPWRYIPGSSLLRVSVDPEGFIDLKGLETLLVDYNKNHMHGNKRIKLIAISGASNVMGSFNDIDAISELAHHHNALILADAAQLIAHRKVSMHKSKIDILVFSAHKAYAPFGSGGLVIRKDLLHLEDATLEKLIDSGNQNVMGITALTKMIQLFVQIGMDIVEEDEQILTRLLLNRLCSVPGLKIYGVCDPNSPRLNERSGVVTLSFDKVPFNLAANRLAEIGGIGVRSGCFCAHLLGKQLLGIAGWRAFLADVGFRLFPKFTKNIIPGLVRISIGLENEPKDIQQLAETIHRLLDEPRTKLEHLLASSKNGVAIFPTSNVRSKLDALILTRVNRVFR